MTEEERYNELKDKNLVVVDYNEDKLNSELEKKGISIDFEELKMLKEKQAKKSIKEIAKALGIHNVNYNNSNINFDFVFSSNSLDSSVHHQGDFKGTYADYAKMLSCLDGIIKNAELVEIHPNYKGNKLLKQVYVLVSAFNDGNVIIPVQLEVKEQYDKNNGLYLNVVLGQIKKEPAVKKEIGVAKAYKDLPLVTGSTISLSQLFANVNTGDNKFLKYIPDKFLSEEQITAKRTAQKADYTKYGRYKEVFEGKPEQKFSLSDPLNRTYSYAELTAKPDMVIKSVSSISLPMSNGKIIRKDVIDKTLDAVRNVGNKQNTSNKIFLYNKDLNQNIKITSDSIKHGLRRKYEDNAIASMALPEYFSEAICINELSPRDAGVKNSYVLLGEFDYNGDSYLVRMVANETNSTLELEDLNVLYSINTKKRPAANKRPGQNPVTERIISISDFLNDVKDEFPDVLPLSVINHYSMQRPTSSLTGLKFSLTSTSEIDYPSLLKENTDLKKQNEALAAEMKLTEGHKVSRGAVEKLAGKILREYKSGYDKTVLADNLEKVFNYIADENADAAQAMDVLSSVAKAVIEQSSEIDASLSEQFSNELDAISSTTFYISPSLKSDLAAAYGSYKDFVNSVKGRIRTTQNPANGTSVDTVWSELTDLAPGIFDEETYSPLDMMIKLEEFVSKLNSELKEKIYRQILKILSQ